MTTVTLQLSSQPALQLTRPSGTGQCFVPYGEFIQFPKAMPSRMSARHRKLPVLIGSFNHERFDFDSTLPSYVGYGMTNVNGANVLTFRLQHGPNMLYWLANAADPCVWEVMDKWAEAKAIVLMAEFSNGETILVNRQFAIAPRTENWRKDVTGLHRLTSAFQVGIADAILEDKLQFIATTDIPTYPVLEEVQGCIVTTPVTGRVLLDAGTLVGTPRATRALVDSKPGTFLASAA